MFTRFTIKHHLCPIVLLQYNYIYTMYYVHIPYYHILWPASYERWASFSGQGEEHCNKIKPAVYIVLCASSAAIRIHRWLYRL